MLVLLSLLVAIGYAQVDCTEGINDNDNTSQKRRQCKKLAGCKWQSAREVNGVEVPGTCSATSTCAALSQNQCKKRNTCYIKWDQVGRPCLDYNPAQEYPCASLSGKRNQDKCNKQPKCIRGSGDRANKVCITIPDNAQDLPCATFDGKPNKYLCNSIEKCTWSERGENAKKCILKRRPEEKSCSSITEQLECNNNPNGCTFEVGNNRCVSLRCNQISDRMRCQRSDEGCQWAEGITAKDYDITKNREKQKEEMKDDEALRTGFCSNGVRNCDDIMTEGSCILSDVNHGISGCYWNPEAKEMGRPRCSTRQPCAAHSDETACLSNNNMFNNRCSWGYSKDAFRCLEFDCTDQSTLDTKNKCNTVGCWWHRNKNKRDPNSKGFCGVYDVREGRRLM